MDSHSLCQYLGRYIPISCQKFLPEKLQRSINGKKRLSASDQPEEDFPKEICMQTIQTASTDQTRHFQPLSNDISSNSVNSVIKRRKVE